MTRATTVAQRQAGARPRSPGPPVAPDRATAERPWQPSWDLQTAVNDLFNQPNLDITADVNIVSPVFDQNLVTSGPIYRKGYWSQVTAGPKTGFGLLPSDDGIAFYNSQLLTSVTPITDFQNQIEQRPARPQGGQALLVLGDQPSTRPSSRSTRSCGRPASRSARPTTTTSTPRSARRPRPGGGLAPAVAGLIGMNQNKITQMVYEGAIGSSSSGSPRKPRKRPRSGSPAKRPSATPTCRSS